MTSGDTGYDEYFQMDHDSTFTFDDVNYKITILLATQSNGIIPGDACDLTYSQIDNVVNSINSFATGGTFSYNTIWGDGIPFTFSNFSSYITMPSYSDRSIFINFSSAVHPSLVPNLCALNPDWYTYGGGSWKFYKCYLRLDITNMSDPLNNYKISNGLNASGQTGAWVVIKQVP